MDEELKKYFQTAFKKNRPPKKIEAERTRTKLFNLLLRQKKKKLNRTIFKMVAINKINAVYNQKIKRKMTYIEKEDPNKPVRKGVSGRFSSFDASVKGNDPVGVKQACRRNRSHETLTRTRENSGSEARKTWSQSSGSLLPSKDEKSKAIDLLNPEIYQMIQRKRLQNESSLANCPKKMHPKNKCLSFF